MVQTNNKPITELSYIEFEYNQKPCYLGIGISLIKWWCASYYHIYDEIKPKDLIYKLTLHKIAEEIYIQLMKLSKDIRFISVITDHAELESDLVHQEIAKHTLKKMANYPIIAAAQNTEILTKLSEELLTHLPTPCLPKLSILPHFQATITLFRMQYALKSEAYLSYNKNPLTLIRAKLLLDGQYMEVFFTKSLIRNFATVLYGIKVKFSYNDFFTYSVLDLILNEVRRNLGISITLIDYSYYKLPQAQSLYSFSLSSSQFQANLMLSPENVALVYKWLKFVPNDNPQLATAVTITNLDKHSDDNPAKTNATAIIAPNQTIKYPVILAKTALNLDEINQLRPGDVLVFGTIVNNLRRTQDVFIDLGRTKIKSTVKPNGTSLTVTDIADGIID